MSDTESLDYLQEDFDPWSLTVPRLRSILVTYNVPYPATAKKSQLVELFSEHVAPRSKSILETRARVKRMSRGIVDADSQSTTSSVDMFDTGRDHQMAPPPSSSRRSRSPKKTSTTRVKRETQDQTHEQQQPPPLRESPRKRQSRSASVQAPGISDTDTGPDGETSRPGRRTTRRAATPAAAPVVKKEVREDEDEERRWQRDRESEREDLFKRTPETADVFTDDNPFQSGSSPTGPAKTPTNRRKTTGGGTESTTTVRAKTPSTGARRRTDGPTHDYDDHEDDDMRPVRAVSTSSRVFADAPILKPAPKTPERRVRTVESEILEPGEEFTPEEQFALAREERANPELAAARQKALPPSRRRGFTTPLLVLLTTLLGAYGAWYRQEKIAVGYCGLGREPTPIIPETIPIRVPEWAEELVSRVQDSIPTQIPIQIPIQIPSEIRVPDWVQSATRPECEPCPPHAYCYEDFSVRCEPGYVLKPHPLALGGLLPLPPTCEPDGEKARRVQAVADKAVDALRERRATYECGEPVVDADEEGRGGRPLESPAMSEDELKAILGKQRSRRMTAEEFEELWVAAIGEVKAREEVVVQVEEEDSRTGGSAGVPTAHLSSSSLARLPYTCAIRRSVRLALARHRVSIAGVILLVVAALYGRARYLSGRRVAAQVPGLVDEVLERLAGQKELAFEDGGAHDAFLFLPNLRDDVLRRVHSLAERDRVWQRVRLVVEQNSNVRTGQRESQHTGELGRAWEWIGPSRVGSADLSESRRRRSAGRISFGPDVIASGSENNGELQKQQRAPGVVHRKWEESRPLY